MFFVLIALTDDKGTVTSSYIESMCVAHVVPSALFDCSKAALIFALLLFKMIAIIVMETSTLMIKAVARQLIDIVDAISILDSTIFAEERLTTVGSLLLPTTFSQATVCKASIHLLWLVGTSVQVTVVWLVVVGQLPQFDARML